MTERIELSKKEIKPSTVQINCLKDLLDNGKLTEEEIKDKFEKVGLKKMERLNWIKMACTPPFLYRITNKGKGIINDYARVDI